MSKISDSLRRGIQVPVESYHGRIVLLSQEAPIGSCYSATFDGVPPEHLVQVLGFAKTAYEIWNNPVSMKEERNMKFFFGMPEKAENFALDVMSIRGI